MINATFQFLSFVFVMALTVADPFNDTMVTEEISKLSVDLRFLLETAGVPNQVQAKIGSLGITTSDVFAKVVSTEAELRTLLKDDVGMDPTAGVPNRVATAKVCNAWESATVRGRKRKEEEETDQRVGDLPRKLPKSDHTELRKAFTARHRQLEDRHTPHPAYIEAKLKELEDGELKCETLSEVISLADDTGGDGNMGIESSADGVLKIRKSGIPKGSPPVNAEQFRQKTKVIAHWWASCACALAPATSSGITSSSFGRITLTTSWATRSTTSTSTPRT